MKTVEDLLNYLNENHFSPETRIVVDGWDYEHDKPCTYDIPDEPVIEEVHDGPHGRRFYKVIHF